MKQLSERYDNPAFKKRLIRDLLICAFLGLIGAFLLLTVPTLVGYYAASYIDKLFNP